MNKFNELWEKVETTTTVKPTFFDKLVYLEIKENAFRCETSDKNKEKVTHFNSEKISNVVVRLDYYNLKVKKFGNNPKWVLSVPGEESYEALSQNLMDAYKIGKQHEVDYAERSNKMPILEVLKSGRFDLIGIDQLGFNSTIIGIDGKPIPSGFHIDYIQSRLFSKKYHLSDLLKYMQSRSDVMDAKIIEVPYYNVNEDEGKRCIEFYFVPVKEDFERITSLDYFDRKEAIFKILDVAKFAKPPVDEDE